MLRLDTICGLILVAAAAAACDDAPSAPKDVVEYAYRFQDGPQGWAPLFAGWHVNDPLAVEAHRMVSGHLPLVPPLASLGNALFIQGGANWTWTMLCARWQV